MKQAGVLSQDEFDKLNADYKKLIEEKDKYFASRNAELSRNAKENLDEKKATKVAEKKSVAKSKKPLKIALIDYLVSFENYNHII